MHPSTGPSSRSPRLQFSPSLPNLREHHAPSRLPPCRQDDSHPPRKPKRSQHYLTPPLTPSSSLKSDGTDLEPADPNASPDTALFGDVHQSRFLIIGNVPRELADDVVMRHLRVLASSFQDACSVPSDGKREKLVAIPHTAIQAVNFRFREKLIVIVALYDIRNADKFKHLIEGGRSPSQHDVNGTQKTHFEGALKVSWTERSTCVFVSSSNFLKLLGESAQDTMTRTEGTFCVSGSQVFTGSSDTSSSPFTGQTCPLLQTTLRGILSKYGDIKAFRPLKGSQENRSQWFIVEYFDVRAAEAAWEDLNGHVVDNIKFQLVLSEGLLTESGRLRDTRKEQLADASEDRTEGDHSAGPKTPKTAICSSHSPAPSTRHRVSLPILNDTSTTSYRFTHGRNGPDSALALNGHSARLSEPALSFPLDLRGSTTDTTGHQRGHSGAMTSSRPGRRGSNSALFDVARPLEPYNPTEADTWPHISSDGREGAAVEEIPGVTTNLYPSSYLSAGPQYGHDYFGRADLYIRDPSMHPSWISSPTHGAIPMQYPQSPMPSMCWDASTGSWFAWPSRNLMAEQWAYPPPTVFHPGLPLSTVHYPYSQQPSPHAQMPSYGHPLNQPASTVPTALRTTPENNQLDIRKIEQGIDTRTTVMIKNIPNKMTDKELINYINDVCPRRIDFLYLRMDFQNGCNVGYAFVNFISVEDLLRFAKMKLNERWNLYSSEKVLQMSYANYQGKEALVEKFKNSCIMDEREEWRPKIFHSEPGSKQGLPEEFPKPTHIRRKERSSFNRGALFVPGIPAHQRTFLNANTTRSPSHVDGRRRRYTPNEGLAP